MHETFGGVIGGYNSFWLFMGYVIDSTIYPLLAGEYLVSVLGDENK